MQRTLVVLLVVLASGLVFAGGAVADGSGMAGNSEHVVECEYPVEVEDATGETVTLAEEPERIVVTAPNAAQHMWEIGAQDRVVGMPVTQYTGYLDGRENKTNVVNTDGTPDVEQIVALDPDLVLVPNVNDEQVVQSLREAGITVYYYPLVNDLEAMTQEVENVGLLAGEFRSAADVAAQTRAISDRIAEATADEENPRVYYEFFGFTAGSDTLESDLITRAGGTNIATQADQTGYFELSEEVILQENPEWLILQEGAPIPDSEAVQQSTAVQQDQIVRVDSNLISQHGPRNVQPLTNMAEAFHSGALADVNLESVGTENSAQCATAVDESATGDDGEAGNDSSTDGAMGDDGESDDTMGDDEQGNGESTDEESADDSGPGFTVVAVAAAVAVVSLLARRR
jgi:iron complex transport system substrate-binding protein